MNHNARKDLAKSGNRVIQTLLPELEQLKDPSGQLKDLLVGHCGCTFVAGTLSTSVTSSHKPA